MPDQVQNDSRNGGSDDEEMASQHEAANHPAGSDEDVVHEQNAPITLDDSVTPAAAVAAAINSSSKEQKKGKTSRGPQVCKVCHHYKCFGKWTSLHFSGKNKKACGVPSEDYSTQGGKPDKNGWRCSCEECVKSVTAAGKAPAPPGRSMPKGTRRCPKCLHNVAVPHWAKLHLVSGKKGKGNICHVRERDYYCPPQISDVPRSSHDEDSAPAKYCPCAICSAHYNV